MGNSVLHIEFINTVMQLTLFGFGVYLISDGELLVGEFMAYYLSSLGLHGLATDFTSALASYSRVRRLNPNKHEQAHLLTPAILHVACMPLVSSLLSQAQALLRKATGVGAFFQSTAPVSCNLTGFPGHFVRGTSL